MGDFGRAARIEVAFARIEVVLARLKVGIGQAVTLVFPQDGHRRWRTSVKSRRFGEKIGLLSSNFRFLWISFPRMFCLPISGRAEI